MIGLVASNGFIGRSVRDFLDKRSTQFVEFLRNPDTQVGAVPVQTYRNAVRQLDLVKSNYVDDMFDGIRSIILMSSATKPNTLDNTEENELSLNVKPHINLIRHLKAHTDIKHLIFISSGGAVYGNVTTHAPIIEDTPLAPLSPYGWGKAKIEDAIRKEWDGEDRIFSIIRPANPVGIHQIASRGIHGLVTTACFKIATGEPITIIGSGVTVRDFFAVDGLADLVHKRAMQPLAQSAILNCGSGQGLSITEVVDLCESITKRKAKREFVHGQDDPVSWNVLDVSLARDIANWQLETTLESAAHEVVDYIEEHWCMNDG